jgi:hypothetical protein
MARHAIAAPTDAAAKQAVLTRGNHERVAINQPVNPTRAAMKVKQQNKDILHAELRYSPVNLPVSLSERVRLIKAIPSTNTGMIARRAWSAHARKSMPPTVQA